MSSIRQQIIDSLSTWLKTLTLNNGYQSDIGESVFVCRLDPVQKTECPCLLIKDSKLAPNPEGGAADTVQRRLSVDLVACMAGKAEDVAADARNLEQDLYRCLKLWDDPDSRTDLFDQAEIEQSTLVMEQFDGVYGALHLTVAVSYTCDYGSC